MAALKSLPLCLVVILLSSTVSISARLTPASVFDLLEKNGLPRGLLPSNAYFYSLLNNRYLLVALRRGTCHVWLPGVANIRYHGIIEAKLQHGYLSDIKGISLGYNISSPYFIDVHKIFVKPNEPDSIYFNVDLDLKFNVTPFQTVHTCLERVSLPSLSAKSAA